MMMMMMIRWWRHDDDDNVEYDYDDDYQIAFAAKKRERDYITKFSC